VVVLAAKTTTQCNRYIASDGPARTDMHSCPTIKASIFPIKAENVKE